MTYFDVSGLNQVGGCKAESLRALKLCLGVLCVLGMGFGEWLCCVVMGWGVRVLVVSSVECAVLRGKDRGGRQRHQILFSKKAKHTEFGTGCVKSGDAC